MTDAADVIERGAVGGEVSHQLSDYRSTVRAFVDEVIAPAAGHIDEAQEVPPSVLRAVAGAGYFGAVPGREPGAFDFPRLGVLHEEVGRGCSSVRSLLTVHAMVSYALARWGRRDQQERWLAELAEGAALGAFALSEPGAGSDAAGITACAEPVPGGYRLSGVKRWITGGQLAAVFLVFARTEKGITAFLAERDTPGLTVEPITNLLGTRGSMAAELRFERCFVPDSARLGAGGFGLLGIALPALDLGRYSVASGCVGIIDACLEVSIAHARNRQVGGRPLLEQQLIRQMLSNAATDLRAARLLGADAGRLKHTGDPKAVEATWVAKYFASTAAMRVASDTVQICGALGCSDASPAGRLFRDAKVMEIIEGSSQIQQLTIAQFAAERAR